MGIAYRSTLGEPPTGNAVVGDVLYGKTFSNADGTDKVGTMPNNGAVAPTALDPGGSYTIPAGYHNGQGAVSAKSNTATYTANTRGAALDMGAANLNRYVNTNGVPNSNSGTYTFPVNDTGGTKDLGETNNYRYVNAQNVYNKGKADGQAQGAVLLWSNPNINVGFDAQKVNINLASYAGVIIVGHNPTGLSGQNSSSYAPKGASNYYCPMIIGLNGGQYDFGRYVTVDATGVTFSLPTIPGGSGTVNTYGIPKYIYGINGVSS